ncbi:MAG TPA: winged helix-turn-helix domain-containing protein [Solirubrobacterales bacterium]|nr:winged helix-turn-helix domain-containing protein [Solirubrobacterales bacterium]
MNSFEDRPEDVILRLLDRSAGSSPRMESKLASPTNRRAAPGSVLPVEDYWIPILQVLVTAGGNAPSNDVIDALEDRMSGVLEDRDRERLKSGEIRWRNRARFARLRMKERGLISDISRRGVWAITRSGREYLAEWEETRSE